MSEKVTDEILVSGESSGSVGEWVIFTLTYIFSSLLPLAVAIGLFFGGSWWVLVSCVIINTLMVVYTFHMLRRKFNIVIRWIMMILLCGLHVVYVVLLVTICIIEIFLN